MAKFILGKKIEMSQIFDEKRNVVPVTLIEAGPCYILQIKTKDSRKARSSSSSRRDEPQGKKDGYEAIQIGFEKLKPSRVKKTQKQKAFRYLKEFRGDITKYKVGDEIKVDVFEEGDTVKVSGTSKGKGFQGVVKKWGFHGRPATHGTKHEERTPGSIGSAFPQRVLKGKKMAGRMGADRKTVKNLKIIKIDKENNILAVKGAVPGNRGTLLEIKS